jgi:hypothetical protein
MRPLLRRNGVCQALRSRSPKLYQLIFHLSRKVENCLMSCSFFCCPALLSDSMLRLEESAFEFLMTSLRHIHEF